MHHICDVLSVGTPLNYCFDQIVLQSWLLNSAIQWVLISPYRHYQTMLNAYHALLRGYHHALST